MLRLGRAQAAPVADAATAAATVRTLAVLLHAGAPPQSAWRHLADSGDDAAVRIVARGDSGDDLVSAIAAEGGAWADVAAAWEVATTVGAPLADMLRGVAESLQDAAAASDDIRVALAEPAGTARLMLWLPAAGLLLGLAMGFDTLRVLASPPGAVCVIGGVALVLVARRWTTVLLRKAQPDPATPGLGAELYAVALAGGASIERARRLVSDICGGDESGRTDAVLALSQAAGVPAVELLRAAAAHERHRARVAGRMRAAALASRLLLPLGACTLPAFLLLGIAPLIISVLGSTPLPLGP